MQPFENDSFAKSNFNTCCWRHQIGVQLHILLIRCNSLTSGVDDVWFENAFVKVVCYLFHRSMRNQTISFNAKNNLFDLFATSTLYLNQDHYHHRHVYHRGITTIIIICACSVFYTSFVIDQWINRPNFALHIWEYFTIPIHKCKTCFKI